LNKAINNHHIQYDKIINRLNNRLLSDIRLYAIKR
jgi:hypothetical protein